MPLTGDASVDKRPRIGILGLAGMSVFLNVERFHAPGETLRAKGLLMEPGGKGYNQAVAAQRLGGDCVFFSAMGADSDAAVCESFLKNEGVAPVIQSCEDCATAYACILTDSRGENRVTVYRGAADSLTAEFVRENEKSLASCDVILLGLECSLAATLEALKIAEEHGIYTVLNPAPMTVNDPALMRRFDLITPNLQEACAILDISQDTSLPALESSFRRLGINRVVVTLGGGGALLVDGERGLRFPALRVRPVDTTGAGDCFNAALAVALGRGESIDAAVEYAINASGCSVCRRGVMGSLPTQDEVMEKFKRITPKAV